MQSNEKLPAGTTFPDLSVGRVGGGTIAPAAGSGWRVVIVYRGRHCPLCKKYLNGLNEMLGEFEAEKVAVVAISADPVEKAQADVAEFGWKFPVGHDLSIAQMRLLGTYVSTPRSSEETDRPFSEPGLFVINPEGRVQIVDISNAPFARPDLALILRGIKFVHERKSPIRGTLV